MFFKFFDIQSFVKFNLVLNYKIIKIEVGEFVFFQKFLLVNDCFYIFVENRTNLYEHF